jgi:MATE family, multidrug efflux pump
MSVLEEARPSSMPVDHDPPARPPFARDLRDLLRIAGPVVLAEIGWMSMAVVDSLMVGPLGPQAIGVVGLASVLFFVVAVVGTGLLLGLDTLVSHAYGARRIDECHRWLIHGVALAVLLSIPLSIVIWLGTRALGLFGLHPDVEPLAASNIIRLNYGLLPLLLYAACRRYLQAIGFASAVTFALVSANIVNAFANWVLIYGMLGAPALGTNGSAWATTMSRVYLAAVLIIAVVWHDHRHDTGLWRVSRRIDLTRFRRLLALGGPAAAQLVIEFGVFGMASAFAGKLSPTALAAHQVGINIVAMTYMLPLGVSSAGAVLVGRAIGRRDPHGAKRAGWMALGLGAASMVIVALVLLLVPRQLFGLFTSDTEVIAIGVTIMTIAALFQLFDGLQVVATGALRGAGDTRTPMIWNLAGHWGLGLPVGWWCCFALGWGVVGLWIGLSLGLILVGLVLLAVWARTATRLLTRMPVGPPARVAP